MTGFAMVCVRSGGHGFVAVLVCKAEELFLKFKDVIVEFSLFVFELIYELIEL